jgi:hypothetical protein
MKTLIVICSKEKLSVFCMGLGKMSFSVDLFDVAWKYLYQAIGITISLVTFSGYLVWLWRNTLRRQPEYMAKVVKSKHYAKAASKAVHTIWKGDPLLNKDQYWEIIDINPDLLVCVFDEHNKMVGFFDVFPIRDEMAKQFLDGASTEQELLTLHSIYDNRSTHLANYIYIGTLVGMPNLLKGSKRVRLEFSMVGPLLNYLNDKFPPRPGRIYFAMASTRQQVNWMEQCCFTPVDKPGFAGNKLREIYQLDYKNMGTAIRKAANLKQENGDTLIPIKCKW